MSHLSTISMGAQVWATQNVQSQAVRTLDVAT